MKRYGYVKRSATSSLVRRTKDGSYIVREFPVMKEGQLFFACWCLFGSISNLVKESQQHMFKFTSQGILIPMQLWKEIELDSVEVKYEEGGRIVFGMGFLYHKPFSDRMSQFGYTERAFQGSESLEYLTWEDGMFEQY